MVERSHQLHKERANEQIAPDIPTPLRHIDQLRHFYRLSLAEVNSGIVELTVVQVDAIPAIKLIAKVPQEPDGILVFPS